eukprot:TRINITY_DN8733_c0_g2_i1.p1 TRINITY_DN8733_c0_g2~~TRINITY_DN8733_c0_g2_i1.p1  ORF type:complete len:275 (-),score=53.88 TRINITY_DN8733_c0_g2_i1:211-1035(-)
MPPPITVNPALGSLTRRYMLEAFSVTVDVFDNDSDSATEPEQQYQVQLWSNIPHEDSTTNDWHSTSLRFIESQPVQSGRLLKYAVDLRITSHGLFEFTVRYRKLSTSWRWASQQSKNGRLSVSPPTSAQWTQSAIVVQIVENFYIGNFIAATSAVKLGFKAVLNMAEELSSDDPTLEAYLKLSCVDGSTHPIPTAHIKEAVDWIDKQLQQNRKTIVHCRAGIGRSGSIVVAYLFSQDSKLSYEEAKKKAKSLKSDIYPHVGLKESLEALYPRFG